MRTWREVEGLSGSDVDCPFSDGQEAFVKILETLPPGKRTLVDIVEVIEREGYEVWKGKMEPIGLYFSHPGRPRPNWDGAVRFQGAFCASDEEVVFGGPMAHLFGD